MSILSKICSGSQSSNNTSLLHGGCLAVASSGASTVVGLLGLALWDLLEDFKGKVSLTGAVAFTAWKSAVSVMQAATQ
jgi:hypothetical protein